MNVLQPLRNGILVTLWKQQGLKTLLAHRSEVGEMIKDH